MTALAPSIAPRTRELRPAGGPPPRPRLLLPPSTGPAPDDDSEPPIPPFRLRSVRSPLTESAWPVAARRQPAAATEPPDPTQLCGAVILAAVEALRSTRPLVQLARWVSPAVYESLARAARPTPLRRRAAVRGVRTCRVSATVAEGTAVVHDGDRVRAAAVRLEIHRGSWRATVLQIG